MLEGTLFQQLEGESEILEFALMVAKTTTKSLHL